MKTVSFCATMLSKVFQPTLYPLVGFIILFTLTYMNMLPWTFKLWVLASVCLFTIIMPYMLTRAVCRLYRWTEQDLHRRQRRYVVYAINIISYISCMVVCHKLYLPSFMGAILVVSLLVQCVCVVVNFWYKVSIHSAGTGVIIGALVAYSFIFAFNPIWWLCVAILLSGSVMSSRMYLRGHSLWQVLSGTSIGIACGAVGIMLW